MGTEFHILDLVCIKADSKTYHACQFASCVNVSRKFWGLRGGVRYYVEEMANKMDQGRIEMFFAGLREASPFW